MTSGRYMIVFTRTEPWSSLGFVRRAARVFRILFGSVLFSSLALLAVILIRGLAFSTSIGQALPFVFIVPFVALLAWSVGCMFIWRATHLPAEPSAGGSTPPPPEPPSEGAPRPAPLRPFSPLIAAAHADLPNERSV